MLAIYPHRQFVLILTLLCLLYLSAACFLNGYVALSVDEFWFAQLTVQKYQHALPYRDFAPYKTVLGYYLLLLPFLIKHSLIGALIFTKNFIALLNTLVLFIVSCWLTRFFDKKAVLISLLLLLTTDLTLTYATHIRVDLFAYWFGLFAWLWLLEKRYFVAGICMGLGFTFSQKIMWYVLAGNLVLCYQAFQVPTVRSLCRFNIGLLSIIACYLLFFTALSNWHTVYTSVFTEAAILYHLDWYHSTRLLFWQYTFAHNVLLFTLLPFTWLGCLRLHANDHAQATRLTVILFAYTILMCLANYKQVFPYYMQALIPVFLVLYAAFFTWLLKIWQTLHLSWIILMIAIGLGMTTVLWSFYQKTLFTVGTYQKANLLVLERLLQDNSDYFAGMDLLYTHPQPIAGLKHLMGPTIHYLYAPNTTLRAVMLASLDQDPHVTQASVLYALDHSNVKYYVNNYRIQALPPLMQRYLHYHFTHWWGSIYIYAPLVPAGRHTVTLHFDGRYQIDHATPPHVIMLKKGTYTITAKHSFRLQWVPPIARETLNQHFDNDQWIKLVV